MAKTKKVGSSGRFGAKYGRKIRVRTTQIESTSKAWHECPRCNAPKVKRQSAGIWVCSRCDAVFAGGAYAPAAPEPVLKTVREFEAGSETAATEVANG